VCSRLSRKHRGAIADGADPALARDEHEAEPTINELAGRYLQEYARPHKKPRSAEEDRRNLALHVRPTLGALKVSVVGRQEILKLHHDMRATPTAANRVMALLSKMFGLAEEWGLRPHGSNPCHRIKKFAERQARTISDHRRAETARERSCRSRRRWRASERSGDNQAALVHGLPPRRNPLSPMGRSSTSSGAAFGFLIRRSARGLSASGRRRWSCWAACRGSRAHSYFRQPGAPARVTSRPAILSE
jgi:hypothetical protein